MMYRRATSRIGHPDSRLGQLRDQERRIRALSRAGVPGGREARKCSSWAIRKVEWENVGEVMTSCHWEGNLEGWRLVRLIE